ncbi:hypothetical protein C8Q80DRAFT_1238022 [Daedaleopsis nitida]|nr:hypothetical protein C8Q80DRAFT_1238022 [Daedaleopsis nitida]
MNWEPSLDVPKSLTLSTIPALQLVLENQTSAVYSARQGVVPYVGNLDIESRAQIHNWIDTNIPGAPSTRHLWIGRYPVAHAITLVLIKRMQDDRKPQDGAKLLTQAWAVQTESSMKDDTLSAVDVDAECLRALELRMFERSKAAGDVGYFQWGLDAGDHEEHWDPYDSLPNDWNVGDYEPDDPEELLEKGPHLAEIVVPGATVGQGLATSEKKRKGPSSPPGAKACQE